MANQAVLLVLLAAVLLDGVLAAATPASTTTRTTTTSTPTATSELPLTSTRRTKPLWNQTQTDRLKHDLLLGYDKFARPHPHDAHTEVDLLVVVKHVSVDEFAGTMSLDVWIKMFWTDPKLAWTPSQYGNLSTLHVADHEVWQPDIMLYNSATSPGMSASHYETSQMVVTNDGSVIWVPMTRLEVYCDMDLTHWPYDEHTCEFRMGSWVYDKNHVDIVVHNETFTLDPHVQGSTWGVVKTAFERKETLYACCPEWYVDVSFTVTATRMGAAYHQVIAAPVTTSVMILMANFWIPYERTEKVLLQGINIIVLSFSLLFMSHLVPIFTNHTPNIVKFYTCVLSLATVTLFMTVSLLNVVRTPRISAVCWPVSLLLTHPLLSWISAGVIDNVRLRPPTVTGSVSFRWLHLRPPTTPTAPTVPDGPDGPHSDSVAILPLPREAGVEAMHMENSLELSYARNRKEWRILAGTLERIWCFCIIITILYWSFIFLNP
ncbi:acetylcholine receptor subunit alpha-type acr-16-like [Thrips palmi]|uniref:Acetylcholine receptor subunit alpha-type acr-16-like n=1 Tax=Thrips palmi TaxID=161013 RepID=A0A6P9AF64_THRPL|nr:acetylcholine receptor subunit alpha-type acr-16-like [Thrips palmi]